MIEQEILKKLNSDREFFNKAAIQYGSLDKEHLFNCIMADDAKEKPNNPYVDLAKRDIIDLIYKQANLEGIAVTYPQTAQLYEGRSVAGLSIEGVVKINNLKHAWEFILDTLDAEIDFSYLSQVNYFVQAGLRPDAGKLRTQPVTIGGTDWVPSILSMDEIKQGLIANRLNPLGMCTWLMRSQIFSDGNKRTAQLICNKMLIQRQEGVLAVNPDRLEEFFTLLIAYYEDYTLAPLLDFLESCIITK